MRRWISLMRSMARMSPVGLRRELVGAVAGADGDGQRVELGALDEVGRLLGVGEQLLARHRRFGAVAVFLVAAHGFQRAQAAQLAFDRDAQRVRHVDHLARDVDVVVVAGDGLAVGLRGEPSIITELKPRSMAPWHTSGLWPWSWCITSGMCGQVSMAAWIRCLMKASPAYLRAPALACRITGAPTSCGGRHHGLHLLQVVDVEGRNAVAVFGGMVEQLAHRDECHGVIPEVVKN